MPLKRSIDIFKNASVAKKAARNKPDNKRNPVLRHQKQYHKRHCSNGNKTSSYNPVYIESHNVFSAGSKGGEVERKVEEKIERDIKKGIESEVEEKVEKDNEDEIRKKSESKTEVETRPNIEEENKRKTNERKIATSKLHPVNKTTDTNLLQRKQETKKTKKYLVVCGVVVLMAILGCIVYVCQ
ncbi:hypothetical protein CDIK_1438 [Cucumispora dikerogammari]|nr:hypothetical protein CDIK_1438 [Cucumispora dikerogammari]